jgi:hypothetical protein
VIICADCQREYLRISEMQLVTYKRNGLTNCGILTGKGIIDISAVWAGPNPPRCILDVLQRGEECLAKIKESAQTSEIVISADEVCVRREQIFIRDRAQRIFGFDRVKTYCYNKNKHKVLL